MAGVSDTLDELIGLLGEGVELDPYEIIMLKRAAIHLDRMDEIGAAEREATRNLAATNTMLIAMLATSRKIPEEIASAISKRLTAAIATPTNPPELDGGD